MSQDERRILDISVEDMKEFTAHFMNQLRKNGYSWWFIGELTAYVMHVFDSYRIETEGTPIIEPNNLPTPEKPEHILLNNSMSVLILTDNKPCALDTCPIDEKKERLCCYECDTQKTCTKKCGEPTNFSCGFYGDDN